MKIVFFGPQLSRTHADHRTRALHTVLEGLADNGHHLTYVEPDGSGRVATFPFVQFLRYDSWAAARDRVEAEAADASAIVVVSGFPEGPDAVEWLLELPVPARACYDLDPWDTLGAFDAGTAASWVRADQVPAFHIVFTGAGGPAVEAYKGRWGAEEAVALYEPIDPAVYHPRSPSDELACDLTLVADRHAAAEAAVDSLFAEAARRRPSDRFAIVGAGWESLTSLPANVELLASGPADFRCTVYSSARVVLVAPGPDAIDHAMPRELLEPAACAAACAVVDRPGLASLFRPGEEILVPASADDLVAYLTNYTDAQLVSLGHMAAKRVVADYTKLRASTKFEQRLARKYYRGHNG
jgi:spore maturation protein CgeB